MFESNVRCSFQNGSSGVITEKLYELPLVSDSAVITQDSVAVGFECGSPPEPLVSPWANTRYCISRVGIMAISYLLLYRGTDHLTLSMTHTYDQGSLPWLKSK